MSTVSITENEKLVDYVSEVSDEVQRDTPKDFLTDSMIGVLSGDYNDKAVRTEKCELLQ